ncbi:MAG TPA: glycosyltransferase, partial [Chthoniobacterales bacterium]|nr:glycosyltransferase [Chthoniobacterales bacterium]
LAANEKQWTEALTLLIEQPELRKQMGENARSKILDRYSPQARTAELSALLPELLRSVAHSPAAVQTSTDK